MISRRIESQMQQHRIRLVKIVSVCSFSALMLFGCDQLPQRQKEPPTPSNRSDMIPVPRGLSGLELGMAAEQIREAFRIDEGVDPVAALLTRYGKPEAGKALSKENLTLQKQFFRVSVDAAKTGKFPDGVTSADARATHNIVYQIGLHYDEANVKRISWQGITYPYIAKYGKPAEDTGSSYIWKDGRSRLEIVESGSIINVFFTDEGLEIEVKKEERNGSLR
jgi:hypothetical protein